MKRPTVKRIAVLIVPFVAAAAMLGLAWLVLRFVRFPPCPFLTYLHIYCPGCGATRAVIALMRGDVLLSLRENALILFILTAAALYYIEYAVRVWGGSFRFSLLHRSWVIYSVLALLGVYLIARNFIPAIAPI